MIATITQALVLEVFTDVFEKTTNGSVEKIPYAKLIVYEFGQKFQKATILKLPMALVEDAKKGLGKKSDILVNVFQKQNKMDLTFQGYSNV